MIQVRLEFTGESYRTLSRLERETPRTFRAAQRAAATRAQNRLRKVMRQGGGVYGVPSFAPLNSLTIQIGRYTGPIGGVLAEKDKIVKFRNGDGWVIGWPDRLAGWAGGWQRSEKYLFNDVQRRWMHINHRSLDGVKLPAYYDRPARPIIDPFTQHLADWFPGEVIAQFERKVKNLLKRGKEIN